MLHSMFKTGSGKEVTLPSPPPLRTGRESFPSSGSSQFKAPRKRSRPDSTVTIQPHDDECQTS